MWDDVSLPGRISQESEPGDPDAMSTPPRNPKESLFGAGQMAMGLLRGIVILLAVLSVYVTAFGLGVPERGRAVWPSRRSWWES
jgi:hypothetical protein